MAKLFAEQVLTRVSELALRIHGGVGYTRAYPLERHFRDARSFHFEEGHRGDPEAAHRSSAVEVGIERMMRRPDGGVQAARRGIEHVR